MYKIDKLEKNIYIYLHKDVNCVIHLPHILNYV